VLLEETEKLVSLARESEAAVEVLQERAQQLERAVREGEARLSRVEAAQDASERRVGSLREQEMRLRDAVADLAVERGATTEQLQQAQQKLQKHRILADEAAAEAAAVAQATQQLVADTRDALLRARSEAVKSVQEEVSRLQAQHAQLQYVVETAQAHSQALQAAIQQHSANTQAMLSPPPHPVAIPVHVPVPTPHALTCAGGAEGKQPHSSMGYSEYPAHKQSLTPVRGPSAFKRDSARNFYPSSSVHHDGVQEGLGNAVEAELSRLQSLAQARHQAVSKFNDVRSNRGCEYDEGIDDAEIGDDYPSTDMHTCTSAERYMTPAAQHRQYTTSYTAQRPAPYTVHFQRR
jgi:uncharacterized phage infection (PIP) family protein YhgE